MKIEIAKQSLSRKRPVYEPYEIPDQVKTLRDFIVAVVTIEVARFNEGPNEERPLPEDAIWVQKSGGKVGFGARYNDNKVDLEEAIKVALIGFEDGLFRIFVGDEEVTELSDSVSLEEGNRVTLLRLTMLSGRLW